ncbi:MAG: hypothetical protein IPI90_12595 [Saprospiraceae bacterium]|nr:hypothetical protein [Candidatus Vicinibacter affinis]
MKQDRKFKNGHRLFSDPLDQAQDLRGLVRLEPDSSSLELRKELDLIHVKFSDQFQTSKVKLIFDKNIKSKGGKITGS